MAALFDALRVDVGQALRRIRGSPALSIVVIVTLALAIAANTTIFSLLKPTVLRKLATSDPDALVGISATDSRTSAYSAIHLATFNQLRSEQHAFSSLAAYASSVVRVEFAGSSLDTGVEGVTPEYFTVLDARAKAGRVLSSSDDALAAIGIISERLAARLFGDGDAVGRVIVVDGHQVEIVGLLANGFVGVRMDGGDDLFLPMAFLRAIGSGNPKGIVRAQQIIGRLAPGVTLDVARAEVLGRWPVIQDAATAELPPAQHTVIENQRLSVESFARGFSGVRDRYEQSLTMMMGLAVALLAVGCVNLSGLMLARGLTRQHEFAVRRALGVSRRRLLQQTLVDGVLLSLAGLVVAIPLAWWASAVLTSMVSVARVIPLGHTTPDSQVLAIATGVSLVTGVVIGLLPARRAVGAGMDDVLRGRGTPQRLRGSARAVLITQVALSMILVVGAGLFFETLANLYANDTQERTHPILFTRLGRNPLERGKNLGQPYFQNLQQQLAAIPGADAAAFSVSYPAYLGYFGGSMPTEVVTGNDGQQRPGFVEYVSPGFFDLYSITRLRGRDFTWADGETAPRVAIVSETLARQLSGSGDVVGSRIQMASGATPIDLEIVGVVADAPVFNIRTRNVPVVYRAMVQDPVRGQDPMAHVRVTGDTASVHRGYVDAVNAAGQHFVRAMFTMDDWVDNAVVEQQLIAGMAGVAATLAMVLASVGLFGLLAYSVSSRVREIGVRLSVGATPPEVVRMIVREGLLVVIPGVAIGIPLALAVTWAVRSQLYGVSATDPWTVVGASMVFIATAALASWLPARQASRIQPIDALRHDR